MRREGRQHGYVRTQIILSGPCEDASADHQRIVVKKKSSSEPVAGVFAKVPRRPTNHSKFTGKCSKQMCVCYREAPASKAKNKAKGRHKLSLIMGSELDQDQALVNVNDHDVSMDDERALWDDIYSALLHE